MRFQTTVKSERFHAKLDGDEPIEIIFHAEKGAYFGTLRFFVGENPDGNEGGKAYLLKHVDNNEVFTWLPIKQGRKPKQQTRDCSNCGGQFETLRRMETKGGDEIRLCQDCYDGVS